jgi:hypothetical protein
MATFCKCGADKVICQECGRDVCSAEDKPVWVDGTGNVCSACQKKPVLVEATRRKEQAAANVWAKQHWSPKPGNTGFDLMC